jgi:hypothetical protein
MSIAINGTILIFVVAISNWLLFKSQQKHQLLLQQFQ